MAQSGGDSWIIDQREAGLFRVKRRAFTDPEVLAAERERVFDRSWLYVGHESEIPARGDFRARDVAGRSVILVRGDDQRVRVLLNTCRHRGAEVCRTRAGSARSFQCFYHGWTYANDGRLVGVPGRESYAGSFTRAELGLASPPRVESYRGFVFASFYAEIVDLASWLAGAREYLDLVCDQSDAGMEVVGGENEYGIRANWKLLAENSLDGYHAITTHSRYLGFLVSTGVDFSSASSIPGRGLDLGNGHSVMEYDAPWGRPIARWSPSFHNADKQEIEARRRALDEKFGPDRAHRMAHLSRNLLIFPNLVVNDIMAITIRSFSPIACDEMRVRAWALAPSDETPQDRARRLDNFLTFLGPGGFATPDDVEALESCQRGFSNDTVEWNDLSRGIQREQPEPADELQLRTFWRHWNDLVSADPARAETARRLRAL